MFVSYLNYGTIRRIQEQQLREIDEEIVDYFNKLVALGRERESLLAAMKQAKADFGIGAQDER